MYQSTERPGVNGWMHRSLPDGPTILRQLFSNVLLLVLRCNDTCMQYEANSTIFLHRVRSKSQGLSKNSLSLPTQNCQCLMCYVLCYVVEIMRPYGELRPKLWPEMQAVWHKHKAITLVARSHWALIMLTKLCGAWGIGRSVCVMIRDMICDTVRQWVIWLQLPFDMLIVMCYELL